MLSSTPEVCPIDREKELPKEERIQLAIQRWKEAGDKGKKIPQTKHALMHNISPSTLNDRINGKLSEQQSGQDR